MPSAVRGPPLPLALEGTASPGDVFAIRVTTGAPATTGSFELTGDHGTPADASDDVRVRGTTEDRGGAFPLHLTVTESNAPDLAVVGASYEGLRLPGLGLAIALENVVISAVEPGACAVPSGEWVAFESGFGIGPDARWNWAPLGEGRVDGDATAWTVGAASAEVTEHVTLSSPTCDGSHLTFAAVSTPYTEARTMGSPYAYEGPTASDVTGWVSTSGVLVLDYGYRFGSLVAARATDVLPPGSDGANRLATRIAGRTIVGYLTTHATMQPTGADREDPAIARHAESRAFQVRIVMGDARDGLLSVLALDGAAVLENVPVTLQVAESGVQLLLDGGSAMLGGIVVDVAEGTSFALSGRDTVPTPVYPVLWAPPGAGEESYVRRYAMHLRMSTPRGCFDAGLTLPSAYVDHAAGPVASLRSLDVQRLALSLDASNRSAVAILADGSRLDLTSEPPFALVRTHTRVELSTSAAAQVRLLCGPEYPWAPGGDLYAAVAGVDTGAAGSLGFASPGTYVIESSEGTAPGGAGAQYYVLEVND